MSPEANSFFMNFYCCINFNLYRIKTNFECMKYYSFGDPDCKSILFHYSVTLEVNVTWFEVFVNNAADKTLSQSSL